MTTIAELWQAIENQYAAQGALHLLKPGASAQALDALEAQIGQPLPADLRESLLRHDGSTDSGWVHGELLSVAGMVGAPQGWQTAPQPILPVTLADLAAQVVAAEGFTALDAPVRRLTMPDIPSPHNPVLLDRAVPSVAAIHAALNDLLEF